MVKGQNMPSLSPPSSPLLLWPLSPTHLFEHQRALPRSDSLWQLGNAALVEVRPREAAVVDKDFGAAVAAVG